MTRRRSRIPSKADLVTGDRVTDTLNPTPTPWHCQHTHTMYVYPNPRGGGGTASLKVLFVCGISLTSSQLIVSSLQTLPQDHAFSQVVLRHRGSDRIYEMRCLFVAVGLNALFIGLPHWDNMSGPRANPRANPPSYIIMTPQLHYNDTRLTVLGTHCQTTAPGFSAQSAPKSV